MSPINLVILGFIMDKPMNPYELTKQIKNYRIDEMVKISIPAIYKNIIKLHEKGYVTAQIVRTNDTNEKTVYSMTQSGRKYFMQLMQKFALDKVNFNFDFNAFIVHLNHVDKSDGLMMLKNLKNKFYKKKRLLQNQLKVLNNCPFAIRAVVQQQYMVAQTLIKWVENMMEEYQSAKIG